MAKAGVFNLSPKQKHALSKLPPGMRAAKMAEYRRQATGTKAPAGRKTTVAPQRPNRGWGVSGGKRRGAGHYDAFDDRLQPIARNVGHATAVRGFGRMESPAFNDGNEQLFIFSPGANRVVGLFGNKQPNANNWRTQASGTDTNTVLIDNMGYNTPEGPSQTLFGKFSIRLRNISKAMDASGSVYVLSLNAGVELEQLTGTWGDKPNWTRLRNYVMGSPKTRVFSGSELLKTRQWNTHPIDANRSLEFTRSEENDNGAVMNYRLHLRSPPYSSIVMLFIPGPTDNKFEFSYAMSNYCRYEVNGPLANSAQRVPTAPISVIDNARGVVEAVGGMGHLVSDVVGTINAYAPAGL